LALMGALPGPAAAYAVDSTTDTAGQHLDDATITGDESDRATALATKVSSVRAVHNKLTISAR
jgi:hypothetical protein